MQRAISHMFHEANWVVCMRNDEYMVYNPLDQDYIPTCVGAGLQEMVCDDTLLVCPGNLYTCK